MFKEIKINTGLLAFFAFCLIYPLDAIFYIGSLVMPSIPVGVIGLTLSIFFIPFFIFEKRPSRFYYPLSVYLLLSALIGLLVLTATNYEVLDLWVYFRQFIVAFILGYYLSDFFLDKIESYMSTIKVFSYIVLFGLLGFVVFQFFLPKDNIESNYLRFSESIALTGFLLLILNRRLSGKVIIATSILVLLFLAESRFSLFSFVLSCCVYFFFISRKVFTYFLIIFLVIISVVLIADSEVITGSRYFRLIFQPEEDTSLAARKELMDQGIKIAQENPILGEFAYHREICKGCYVHNILSFWIEFGLIGAVFVLLNIGLILYNFIYSVKRVLNKTKKHKEVYEVYILFCTYILIGVIFSKHWNYTSFFLLNGFSFYILKYRLGASRASNCLSDHRK